MHGFAKLLTSSTPTSVPKRLLFIFYLNRWLRNANLIFAVVHAQNLPTQAISRRKSHYSNLMRSSSRQLQSSHAGILVLPKHPALINPLGFYYVVHTLSGFGETSIIVLDVPEGKGLQRRHF
jgi:hypothetical protein